MTRPSIITLRVRLADALNSASSRAFANVAQRYTFAMGLPFPLDAVFGAEPRHFMAWSRREVAGALRILRRLSQS